MASSLLHCRAAGLVWVRWMWGSRPNQSDGHSAQTRASRSRLKRDQSTPEASGSEGHAAQSDWLVALVGAPRAY